MKFLNMGWGVTVSSFSYNLISSDAWNYPNQQSLLARGVYLTLNLCLYLSFTQIAMLSQLLQAGAVNCQMAAPIYEKM